MSSAGLSEWRRRVSSLIRTGQSAPGTTTVRCPAQDATRLLSNPLPLSQSRPLTWNPIASNARSHAASMWGRALLHIASSCTQPVRQSGREANSPPSAGARTATAPISKKPRSLPYSSPAWRINTEARNSGPVSSWAHPATSSRRAPYPRSGQWPPPQPYTRRKAPTSIHTHGRTTSDSERFAVPDTCGHPHEAHARHPMADKPSAARRHYEEARW